MVLNDRVLKATMVKIAQRRPQHAYLLLVLLAVGLLILAAVGQVSHPSAAIGRDTWTIMPVRDWGFAVGDQAGFWDGVDRKTHQPTAGRIYIYGCVWRSTQTQ